LGKIAGFGGCEKDDRRVTVVEYGRRSRRTETTSKMKVRSIWILEVFPALGCLCNDLFLFFLLLSLFCILEERRGRVYGAPITNGFFRVEFGLG
jgi:hypothetical protein